MKVVIAGVEITASSMRELLDILYALILDYRETGKGKGAPEYKARLTSLKPQIQKWMAVLPSLKDAVNYSIVGGDRKIISLVALGDEIRKEFNTLRLDEEFSSQELDLLKAAGLYLRNNSEAALKKLTKFAGAVSPWSASKLIPKRIDQRQIEPELKRIVQQFTGRADTFLTIEEARIARAQDPELYKEYLALTRQFNQSWKDALVAYVRGHEDHLVPYTEVLEFLDQQGITYRLPKGFTGLVDDQGRFYTNKRELIDGVPAATTSPIVEMNKAYGPNSPWVFKALKADGAAPTYFYTTAFKGEQSRAKFELVRGLDKKLPGARKKWFAKVKNFKLDDDQSVIAAILETLWQTSGRIGTRGNATFGIGTLLVQHLKPQANGDLHIIYLGKDSVRTKHVLKATNPEQKFLIPALLALAEGKQPKEPLFTNSAGRPVIPATVNKAFKTLVGNSEATVHKIRTFRGTEVFNEHMAKVMPTLIPKVQEMAMKSLPSAEKLAQQEFLKAAENVGKVLNHVRRGAAGDRVTGTTAIANYIDVAAMVEWFRALDLRPPRMLEKLLTR